MSTPYSKLPKRVLVLSGRGQAIVYTPILLTFLQAIGYDAIDCVNVITKTQGIELEPITIVACPKEIDNVLSISNDSYIRFFDDGSYDSPKQSG